MGPDIETHFRSTEKLADPIPLTTVPVSVAASGGEFLGDADLRVEFGPDPWLKIDAVFPAQHPALLDLIMRGATTQIAFPGNHGTIDAAVVGGSIGSTAQLSLRPTTEPIRPRPRGQTAKMGFHLVNFREFFTQDGNQTWDNWAELLSLERRVVIAPADINGDARKAQRQNGGYLITHVGSIERRDGKALTARQIDDACSHLFYFLAFARGSWTGPFLAFGTNKSGKKVWEEWGSRLLDSTPSRPSWLHRQCGEALSAAYPGFMDLWQDRLWQPVLKKAIHWYVIANNQVAWLDGSIVLIQAVLEQLAWNMLVRQTNSISEDGFEKLAAADQLRLLLARAEIPSAIPSVLKATSAIGKELNLDGPGIFTEFRNSVVHPGRRGRRIESRREQIPHFELWTLGLWYVELALLSAIRFHGRYRNRLHFGEVRPPEAVPWSK